MGPPGCAVGSWGPSVGPLGSLLGPLGPLLGPVVGSMGPFGFFLTRADASLWVAFDAGRRLGSPGRLPEAPADPHLRALVRRNRF